MSGPAGKGTTLGRSAVAQPGEDARRLSAVFRAWLKWHGLTQRDVASIVGCSESSMSVLIARKRSGRRDGALRRLVCVLVDAVGSCEVCGRMLPDGLLADELGRLLEARRA
jgi:hypothetical protein